jgi:hypothetical protein
MDTRARTLFVLALRALSAIVLMLACAGCVSSLPRYHEPARIEAVALGAEPVTSDLIVIDVVWSIRPRDQEELLIEIPRDGAETTVLRLRGEADPELGERARTFLERRTETWTPERRAAVDLRSASDVPAGERREYELENVRRAKDVIDLVVTRRADGGRVHVGTARLPKERTPPPLSPVSCGVFTVLLGAVDLVWIPVSAASFVALIPFGSLAVLAPDDRR